MQPLFIVPAPMRFQQHLGFWNGGKGFTIQQLVAQLAVEALLNPILPRAARINVMGRGAAGLKPRLNIGGDELWAIVAANELRNTARQEQRP